MGSIIIILLIIVTSFMYNEITTDDKFHLDNIKAVKQAMFVLGIIYAILISILVNDFLKYLHL